MIDIRIALQSTDGDREMLCQMAELFVEEGPKQLQAVEMMIDRGDAEGLRNAAHTLKGSVAIFGASSAQLAAERVEQIGAAGDWSDVEQARQALVQQCKQLTDAITELLARPGTYFDEAS